MNLGARAKKGICTTRRKVKAMRIWQQRKLKKKEKLVDETKRVE